MAGTGGGTSRLVPDKYDAGPAASTSSASKFLEERFPIQSPQCSHLDYHRAVAFLALDVRFVVA